VDKRTSGIRIEKLLRKDRGERLFSGVSDAGAAVLQLKLSIPYGTPQQQLDEDLSGIRKALVSISSRRIPRFVELEIREGRFVELTTEEGQGIVLSDVVPTSGRLDLPHALQLADQVVASLEPLHRAALSYGMCRPDRLLLDRSGNVVIPEPGVLPVYGAVMAKELAPQGGLFLRLFGGPEMVPPEVLRTRKLSPANDVFQFGVLMFRLLSGAGPFGTGLSMEIFNRMLRGQAASLIQSAPGIPMQVARLVSACLDPDPRVRPQGATALRAELLALNLPRADLAELTAGRAEARYSTFFKEMLAIHPGGASDVLELEPTGEAPPMEEKEKQAILSQLSRPRRKRSRSGRLWTIAFVLALIAGGVLLAPSILDPENAGFRKHEGQMPQDGTGLTHQTVVWEGSRPHPTPASLMEAIPAQLKDQVELLGVPIHGGLELVAPVLPPYQMKATGPDGAQHFLRFTARNRLHSIVLPPPVAPGAPARLVPLYDADGVPRSVQVIDATGMILKTVQVGGAGS